MKEIIKDINFVLKYFNKHKVSYLITLMIIVSLLEIVGISLIIPFVSVLIDPNSIENKYYFFLQSFFSGMKQELVPIFFIICIVLFYTIKNFFIIYVVYKQTRYSMNLITLIRLDLFKRYLSQNYVEFIKKDHSELISNIMNVSATFGSTFMISLLIFISEFFIVFSLIVFLFIYNFKLTLSLMIIFLVILFVYYHYLSPRLRTAGNKRIDSDQQIINYSKISFQNIKELKLFNKENYFIDRFISNAVVSEDSNTFYQVTSQYPRIGMELFAVIGICLLTLLMNIFGYKNIEIVTTLAFFGIAIFRLLPSANKLMFSFQSLRFSKKTLSIIRKELSKNINFDQFQNNINKTNIEFKTKIILKDIYFSYSSEKPILKNLNLVINKGEFIGIKGESGSGKTTLIDILMGLIHPDKGEIKIDDVDIYQNLNTWKKKCGYVPQNISLINDTIEANIAFGVDKDKIDKSKIKKSILDSDLFEFVNSLRLKEETIIGENGYAISGGQRQRLAIARALYRNPEIIFFDEATSALDKQTEKNILESINKLRGKITLFFVSHNPAIFDNCDRVVDLDTH